jgi:predicted nucleic acid-binding protein
VIVTIDTSVLVAAIIESEPYHAECRSLVAKGGCHLYAHGLAETFSTLTGGKKDFRLSASVVAAMLGDHFAPRLSITALTPAEMLRAMGETESRGVRGVAIFDYLHLVAAWKAKADRVFTLNVSNFRAFHRAGDPAIVHPAE